VIAGSAAAAVFAERPSIHSPIFARALRISTTNSNGTTMIDFTEANIKKLFFGRLAAQEILFTSDTLEDFGETSSGLILKKLFLKPFTNSVASFEFSHPVNIEHNSLFSLSRDIFHGDEFAEKAELILGYLASVSVHPNIKDGDVFVVEFENLLFGSASFRALGFYKIENKETYVDIAATATEKGQLNFKQGIGDKSIDKACLVLYSDEPYTLLIVDKHGGSTDYWIHDFINASPKNDGVGNTMEYLNIAKEYITGQYASEFEVSKPDQIELLNRSISFFKENDQFDREKFQEEVFHHQEVMSSFNNFSERYKQDHDLELMDNFSIVPEVVKRQARVFKNVLKLDKNFHIYIHGQRDLIEKGYDNEKGMSFYKVFFNEEN